MGAGGRGAMGAAVARTMLSASALEEGESISSLAPSNRQRRFAVHVTAINS